MTRKKDKTPDIQGELIGQLGYPKHLPIVLPNTGNSRNEHGMSVRDMQAMLLELYQVEVSKALISSVTDAIKLIYLAMQNIAKKWTMPIKNWGAVINQFSITFEGRGASGPSMKTTVDTLN